MSSMSSSSSRTPLRRAALLAAPLAVLALSLTACGPKHITSMDSPTPSGSQTASPSSEQSGESSSSSSSSASASSEAPKATSVFKSSDPVTYELSSLTIDGESVDPASITALAIAGDASSDTGATLTPIGVCTGAMYTVTGKGSTLTSTAGTTASVEKCVKTKDEKAADELSSVLEGKFEVAVSGNDVTLTGGAGSVQLTLAR